MDKSSLLIHAIVAFAATGSDEALYSAYEPLICGCRR
jgi:hypothetical protein